MNNLQKFRTIVISLLLIISTFGCFDNPDEFVGPTWDTRVNFPVTSKEFDLLELVEKDSSLLKSSQDPATLGLIYFGDTQSVATITIEDELKLDPFETSFSQTIGTIKINIPDPVASEVGVEDWAPGLTSGSSVIFPEIEGNLNFQLNGIETVESARVESGNLIISVENNLPVEIELRGLRLQNSGDKSLIAERSGSNPSDWITIPPSQTDSVNFQLNDKVVTNSL